MGKKKIQNSSAKPIKTVFVIMPFRKANGRKQDDLDSFFHDNLKGKIEGCRSLKNRYLVSRSDSTLDINEKIIRDIYEADVVICDLSGSVPNPNVMYELGLRFALGNKPVILIREDHEHNERIFDIQGLFTHGYSSTRYHQVESHIVEKLKRFEDGKESFESPVLKVLSKQPQIMEALLRRQVRGIMKSIHEGFYACQELLRLKLCDVLVNAASRTNSECLPLPSGPWDIISFFRGIGSTLPGAFFQEVAFDPPAIPGLVGYLTFHPLMDLVPLEISEAFGTGMHGFYFHFFARPFLRQFPAASSYLSFVEELGKLHDCALIIHQYIVADSESEKHKLGQEVLAILSPQTSETA